MGDRPRLAALPERLDETGGKRLAPFLVRNLVQVDPAPCRGLSDDLVVDEEEAQIPGNEATDLLAPRARCVGDANRATCHVTTLGGEPAVVKHVRPMRTSVDRTPGERLTPGPGLPAAATV